MGAYGNMQIKWQDTLKLAEDKRLNPMDIEKSSLQEGIVPQRYARNQHSITSAEQILLLDACVGVCGCGGLGQYIVDQLARMGVGHITAWDPDVFEESNLNRQLLASYDTIGKSKVECSRLHVESLNPVISFTAVQSRWEDGPPGLMGQQQVMVDALDSVSSRLQLGKACARANIPLVHGAAGGWYGQVSVVFPGDLTLQWLYHENTGYGVEKDQGTLPFSAAVIASLQVTEVIKLLLHRDVLRGEVCMVDLLDMSMERYRLSG